MKNHSKQAIDCAIRLRAAVSLLSRRLRADARGEGVSAGKLSVLGQLHRLGPLTASTLARIEGVKQQSLTRLLAELEMEGLIARSPHPDDGRRALLSLMPAGALCLRQDVKRRVAALTSALEAGLSVAEQALLIEACVLIARVSEALGETHGGPPKP